MGKSVQERGQQKIKLVELVYEKIVAGLKMPACAFEALSATKQDVNNRIITCFMKLQGL